MTSPLPLCPTLLAPVFVRPYGGCVSARLIVCVPVRACACLCVPVCDRPQPQVINEYESGRAIPVPAMIAKIERALGVRLPRPAKKK